MVAFLDSILNVMFGFLGSGKTFLISLIPFDADIVLLVLSAGLAYFIKGRLITAFLLWMALTVLIFLFLRAM